MVQVVHGHTLTPFPKGEESRDLNYLRIRLCTLPQFPFLCYAHTHMQSWTKKKKHFGAHGGGGRVRTPIENRCGCFSNILNFTPKEDQCGYGSSFWWTLKVTKILEIWFFFFSIYSFRCSPTQLDLDSLKYWRLAQNTLIEARHPEFFH